MGIFEIDRFALDLEEKPGDSNEVCLAKGFLRLFIDMDGIADEMTYAEIDRVNEMVPIADYAVEVLKARDELRYRE